MNMKRVRIYRISEEVIDVPDHEDWMPLYNAELVSPVRAVSDINAVVNFDRATIREYHFDYPEDRRIAPPKGYVRTEYVAMSTDAEQFFNIDIGAMEQMKAHITSISKTNENMIKHNSMLESASWVKRLKWLFTGIPRRAFK